MLKNVRYISLLPKKDLDGIEALIHIHAGSGIIMNRTADGLEITVDTLNIYETVRKHFVRASDRSW